MGLLDRPQQAQRFGLLSPDVMQLIQSGGPRVAPAPAPAPAQRQRVSGWRVLDRVLGGETVSEGLDAERARLQAEAERPQMMAQRQQALESIRDPRERALFLGMGGEDWQKNVGQQFAPQVIAAGGIQSVIGNGQRVGAPQSREFGDRIATTDPLTGQTTYTDPRPMTPGERTAETVAQTGRINALNVPVAPNTDLVDPTTGRKIYQGYRAPDIQNVAPGGEALVFDENGNIINRVGSTQERPPNPAVLKRADDIELALTVDENSIARVERALASITDPDGPGPAQAPVRVGPLENAGASFLNATGQSNANSLGIAGIITTVESLRQGILNDATGPQTEGDALRALDSILAGRNDPAVIRQGFQDYLAAKRRTAAVRRRQMEELRASGGAQPAPAAPAPSTTPRVAYDAQGRRYVVRNGQWVAE